MSYFGSLMTLCWVESLVAKTSALKFKITEASWKRKQNSAGTIQLKDYSLEGGRT